MADSENIDKKAEEFNEYMLKQAAITFSMEGISRDLKAFLQKKITHNRTNMTQLSALISSIMQSGSKSVKENVFKKGSYIADMLEHTVKESKFIDVALNLIIQNILTKEAILSSDSYKDTKGR